MIMIKSDATFLLAAGGPETRLGAQHSGQSDPATTSLVASTNECFIRPSSIRMSRGSLDLHRRLIGPRHRDYDSARKMFTGAFDKRPALIARCTSAADVQVALAYAREHDLVVAVRGGGHSIPGHSPYDGGLVIDTARRRVSRSMRSRGPAGSALATWAEFDAVTQVHGLAVTGGRVPHTGIAGLTLNSGWGWLERVCGATCKTCSPRRW